MRCVVRLSSYLDETTDPAPSYALSRPSAASLLSHNDFFSLVSTQDAERPLHSAAVLLRRFQSHHNLILRRYVHSDGRDEAAHRDLPTASDRTYPKLRLKDGVVWLDRKSVV